MKAIIVLREQRGKKKKTRQKAVEKKVLLKAFELLRREYQREHKEYKPLQEVIDNLEECQQIVILEKSSQILFCYPNDIYATMDIYLSIIIEMFCCFL